MSRVDLLPPNATAMQHSLAGATDRAHDFELTARDLWNPDRCPVDFLPWLAWSFSIDNWNDAWPEHTKRAVIKAAIATQRIKGTRKAVREVVQSYGGTIALREPYEPGGSQVPHTFDVVITDGGIANSGTQQSDLHRAILNTKPARSSIALSVAVSGQQTQYIAGGGKPITMHRFDGVMEAAA